MITLTFTVDNIATVISIYDYILIERAELEVGPFTTVSGLGPITLVTGQTQYIVIDPDGVYTDWYRSRYYAAPNVYSGYSDAVLGDTGDLYYNPTYPPEVSYGSSQQLVLNRIRRLIGDPKGLYREYGEDARSSIMADDKTYELDEKGWPAAITINGVSYTETSNPTINGYKYLKFNDFIDATTITCSGNEAYEIGIDVWYYTFRHSDRQLMEAYDNCPVPPGLTMATANSEHFMLQTAIDTLMQENWEYSAEDGAVVRDEGSTYDPSPGFVFREDLIDKLQKRLDDAIKQAMLSGISGVRVE
jgi:hypothetical protein